jgi:hypothetical protein
MTARVVNLFIKIVLLKIPPDGKLGRPPGLAPPFPLLARIPVILTSLASKSSFIAFSSLAINQPINLF